MKCIICEKDIKSNGALSKHIHCSHKISSEDYYNMYLKKDVDYDYCKTCGKKTSFVSISVGYKKHCNAKCAQLDPLVMNKFRLDNPQKNEQTREKTKNTCMAKYNCECSLQNHAVREKSKKTLMQKYGVELKLLEQMML